MDTPAPIRSKYLNSLAEAHLNPETVVVELKDLQGGEVTDSGGASVLRTRLRGSTSAPEGGDSVAEPFDLVFNVRSWLFP